MAVTPILVQRQARRLSELLGSDLLLCLRVVALYTKKNSAVVKDSIFHDLTMLFV